MNKDTRGYNELCAIDAAHGETIVKELTVKSPTLAKGLVDFAFGEVFARAELGRRERELITVALLGTLGATEPQLRVHIKAALNVGADKDELLAVAEHVSVYAGFPRALNLLREVHAGIESMGLSFASSVRRIAINGHETCVADSGGDLPPVVLLHAIGLDHQMWRDVIPHLAKTNRVIAYDLRGHGAAAYATPAENMYTYVEDMLELMDALNIPHASIAGLSFGGAVAQCVAVSNPERIDMLVLIATTAWAQPGFTDRALAAETQGMQAQLSPTLTRWFTPGALAVNSWPVRYAREKIIRAQVRDWAATWRAFSSIDVAKLLVGIRLPTLLIAGEHDPSTPPELMKKLSEHIQNSEFHVISGAPHMISLECPMALADKIQQFLRTPIKERQSA
jgi:3-oxoadipate enol-lactonase